MSRSQTVRPSAATARYSKSFDDVATVAEDASPTAINVLANDSDAENDAFFIASASDPANGTVVLTGGTPGAHTGLTYEPDDNYCGADSFTYTLTPGGDTATVSITVTCVNDDQGQG